MALWRWHDFFQAHSLRSEREAFLTAFVLTAAIPPYNSGKFKSECALFPVFKECTSGRSLRPDLDPPHPERRSLAQVQDLRGAEQRPERSEVAFELHLPHETTLAGC